MLENIAIGCVSRVVICSTGLAQKIPSRERNEMCFRQGKAPMGLQVSEKMFDWLETGHMQEHQEGAKI